MNALIRQLVKQISKLSKEKAPLQKEIKGKQKAVDNLERILKRGDEDMVLPSGTYKTKTLLDENKKLLNNYKDTLNKLDAKSKKIQERKKKLMLKQMVEDGKKTFKD